MQQKPQNRAACFLVAFLVAFSITPALANEGAKSKEDGPKYVDFKNIVVPVIKKDGKTGVISLSVMAEVKDDEAKSNVTSHLPKLRDAFIRVLYGNLDNKKFVREDGALNIDNIKERLMKTAAYVMKDDESPIKDILFQNIAQQSY